MSITHTTVKRHYVHPRASFFPRPRNPDQFTRILSVSSVISCKNSGFSCFVENAVHESSCSTQFLPPNKKCHQNRKIGVVAGAQRRILLSFSEPAAPDRWRARRYGYSAQIRMSIIANSGAPVGLGVKPPPAPGPARTLTNRERCLDAFDCRPVDHPPVWLMRQAGRALPEYRALKKKYSFLELVQTPELATEVTLQPIRRFDFDAAILFSDILVIAEGLGQSYEFQDEGGIQMDFLVQSAADVDRLEVNAVTERLEYVGKALAMIKSALANRTALLGFAGSPWTLANFMLEGGGVREYKKAKSLLYSDPELFGRLLDILTRAITGFLQLQIDAGAEAVQIFDSLGGLLSDSDFVPGSARWLKQIISSLKGRVPVIVFAKGAHANWDDLVGTGAQALGIDAQVRLAEVAARLPERIAVQGNLDPFLLTTTSTMVAAETKRILREMRGRPGHVFNLGHGVPPNAKLENIESLVSAVRTSP
jgi:uroporphyrinogen decarboxylase